MKTSQRVYFDISSETMPAAAGRWGMRGGLLTAKQARQLLRRRACRARHGSSARFGACPSHVAAPDRQAGDGQVKG
jgi:hypothetical protein